VLYVRCQQGKEMGKGVILVFCRFGGTEKRHFSVRSVSCKKESCMPFRRKAVLRHVSSMDSAQREFLAYADPSEPIHSIKWRFSQKFHVGIHFELVELLAGRTDLVAPTLKRKERSQRRRRPRRRRWLKRHRPCFNR